MLTKEQANFTDNNPACGNCKHLLPLANLKHEYECQLVMVHFVSEVQQDHCICDLYERDNDG